VVPAISLALILALAFSAWRLALRYRAHRLRLMSPGGSAATAIVVRSFDGMDDWMSNSRCSCRGALVSLGEDSIERDGRRLRIVHAECIRCEQERSVFFDVTRVFN
jgi:hypothetical protein